MFHVDLKSEKVSGTDESLALSDNWPMLCQREIEEVEREKTERDRGTLRDLGGIRV